MRWPCKSKHFRKRNSNSKEKTCPKEQQHFGKHNVTQNTQASWKTRRQYFRRRNISEKTKHHFQIHSDILGNHNISGNPPSFWKTQTNTTIFQTTQQRLYKAQQHFSLFTLIFVMLCTNNVFCEMLLGFDPQGSRSIVLFKDM